MTDELVCPNCGEETLHAGTFISPFPSPTYPEITFNGYLCTSDGCYSFYIWSSIEVKEANP